MNRDQQVAIVAGGGLLAWWALSSSRRQAPPPVGTVTTSEGFDLTPYGGMTSYPQPIKKTAEAIARQEGFYASGSVPQRSNNPGDLKIPGAATLPGTSITMFATPELGWNALYKQLDAIVKGRSDYYDLDMTIDQMAQTWTTTQQIPWATNVAAYLGVPRSTPLWRVLA